MLTDGLDRSSGLYVMYTHMIKQRRKVYGGQKLGAKPKTH